MQDGLFTELVRRSEEIFDVVNGADRVIGRLPRSVVHRRKLFHRSVHGIVLDVSGRVFMQLRSPRKDCNPGLWDSSVAGHLEAGETYDQAIVRETGEELGIRLSVAPKKLFKLDASEQTGFEFCWVYLIRDSGPIRIDRKEAIAGRWLERDELSEWIETRPDILTNSLKLIWHHYLKES